MHRLTYHSFASRRHQLRHPGQCSQNPHLFPIYYARQVQLHCANVLTSSDVKLFDIGTGPFKRYKAVRRARVSLTLPMKNVVAWLFLLRWKQTFRSSNNLFLQKSNMSDQYVPCFSFLFKPDCTCSYDLRQIDGSCYSLTVFRGYANPDAQSQSSACSQQQSISTVSRLSFQFIIRVNEMR